MKFKLSQRNIIGTFYQRLEQEIGSSYLKEIGREFKSDQESEEYAWLGQSPSMREWVGGRQAKGLTENGFTIKNKKFEATLEVSVDDIRRDKSDQVYTRIVELAERTQSHWAKLVSTLIDNGESGLCYDGQYYFDTDHSEGQSGTQSNLITVDLSDLPVSTHGTVASPSPDELEMSIFKGLQQILSFKDDQGEPINDNARSFLVMCGIPYMDKVLAATQNKVLNNGKTNTLVSSGFNLQVVPNPRLNWSDKFVIFRTDGQVKPFILQQEEGVTMKAVAENSELEFYQDVHHYGVKAIRNAGYGMWQHACMVKHVA